MAKLSQLRRRFTVGIVVLSALCLASVSYLLLPLGSSRIQEREQAQQARDELRRLEAEVVPLKDIDRKLATAKGDIQQFYKDRLPLNYSTISAELNKLANENHVAFSNWRYDEKPTEVPELRQVEITGDLSGDYLRIAKFINALERDKSFFVINSVNLSESQGGGVKLQLNIKTFLRSES